MRRIVGTRGLAALIVSVGALVVFGAGASSGATTAGPSIKTFSFIAKPSNSSKGKTIVNVDGLLLNARCSSNGSPVVYAFSGVSNADLLGHMFDGAGRTHIIHNTSFDKGTNKGVLISSTSSDFDASGAVMFETSAGKVVTVNYAFDNATTLTRQNVCTVYGSYVAT
jgi:hypothetical protein